MGVALLLVSFVVKAQAVQLNCSAAINAAAGRTWGQFLGLKKGDRIKVMTVYGTSYEGRLVSDNLRGSKIISLNTENTRVIQIPYEDIVLVEYLQTTLVRGEMFQIIDQKGHVVQLRGQNNQVFTQVQFEGITKSKEVAYRTDDVNVYAREIFLGESLQRMNAPFIAARLRLKEGDLLDFVLRDGLTFSGAYHSETEKIIVIAINEDKSLEIDKSAIQLIARKGATNGETAQVEQPQVWEMDQTGRQGFASGGGTSENYSNGQWGTRPETKTKTSKPSAEESMKQAERHSRTSNFSEEDQEIVDRILKNKNNPYKVFGLETGTSLSKIQTEYRYLLKKFNYDVGRTNTDAVHTEELERIASILNASFSTIKEQLK